MTSSSLLLHFGPFLSKLTNELLGNLKHKHSILQDIVKLEQAGGRLLHRLRLILTIPSGRSNFGMEYKRYNNFLVVRVGGVTW